MCLKRKMYNICILSVATYDLETGTLTDADKLSNTQRVMKRRMLRQRIKNEKIHIGTKITGIIQRIAA